jgi:hypothetical protein
MMSPLVLVRVVAHVSEMIGGHRDRFGPELRLAVGAIAAS